MRWLALITLVLALALPAALTQPPAARAGGPMLANGPLPPVPTPPDNPPGDAKVRLGAQLYFDTRLSADNTISCGSCHDPRTGWANPHPTDTGIRGQVGGRNSGTIINAAYMRYQFWDGRAGSLEEQALGPIHNPIEMGETLENVVAKLNAIPGYKEQFRHVFGTDATADGIARAIAAFERTIVTGPAPYDRWLRGEKNAMSPAAVRGMRLFNGKAHCSPCHSGPLFSDQGFHNIGVGMDRPDADLGRYAQTKDPADWGRFKVPTLRNIEETPPYLHTGAEKTLMDVVNYYDRGGVPNAKLDPLMLPLGLTQREKQDLVEFMKALTGPVPKVEIPGFPAGPGAPADPKGGLR